MTSQHSNYDHGTPEFWADDDEIEGAKATLELSQQGQLFPENIALGRTSLDRSAIFKLPASDLLRLLQSAGLYSSLPEDSDKPVVFTVVSGRLLCRMRRGGVYSSATVAVLDPDAVFPHEEVSFQYPLVSLQDLAKVKADTINRIDVHKKLWSVRMPWSRARLRLTAEVVDPCDVEPWTVSEREPLTKIDPAAVSHALTFASKAATARGPALFSTVEIADGVARGRRDLAIASVTGEALNGVKLVVAVSDVNQVCRLLRRMDPQNTYLSASAEFQFITSGALEMAIRIPKHRQPPLSEGFLDQQANVSATVAYEPLVLGLNAASPLAVRQPKLDIEVRQLNQTELQWCAQIGTGRFRLTSSIVLADAAGRVTERDDLDETTEVKASDSDWLAQPLSARLEHKPLLGFLWAMYGADTVKIGRRKNCVLIDSTVAGLRHRVLMSTIGDDDGDDVSNES